MKKIVFPLFFLLALFGCRNQDSLQGSWEFAYAWPIEVTTTNDEAENDEEDEAIAIATLMLNIAMSDFDYTFGDGVVYVKKEDEPSEEAVGSYDKYGNICLINNDENYDWSFHYQVDGDSLYLNNDDCKIVFVRNTP